MTEYQSERELVALSCRMLGTLGLTKEATGHVSSRLPGDRILIRARGPGELGVRYTESKNVIITDLDGRKLDGAEDLAAPIEVYIHTELYRSDPKIQSVVHVHPPTLVLFTVCDVPLLPIYGAYDPTSLRLITEGVPTFDRARLVSNVELGRELAETMHGKRACLMRGHGITTVGQSVQDATITAIKLNELGEMNYRARLLGTPRPISEDDMQAFNSAHGAATGRAGALWRYYCRLIEDESTD